MEADFREEPGVLNLPSYFQGLSVFLGVIMDEKAVLERKIELLEQAVDIKKMEVEYTHACINGYRAKISQLMLTLENLPDDK